MTNENGLQQYTCPDCGAVGANRRKHKSPYCHVCPSRVLMKKSNNGRILEEIEKEEPRISKEQHKRIRDAQRHLKGYPNFLWFCSAVINDADCHSFTVYARDAEQALERVKEALKKAGVEYRELWEPTRKRTNWEKI